MADNYIGWEALDAQLRWVSDKATRVMVVRNYKRGDSYDDITSKMVCWHHVSEAPLFGDIHDDYVLSGASELAPNRVLPYLGSPTLIAVGSNHNGNDTAIAVVQDNQQRILFVLNEAHNATVNEGQQVKIQPFNFYAFQHMPLDVIYRPPQLMGRSLQSVSIISTGAVA